VCVSAACLNSSVSLSLFLTLFLSHTCTPLTHTHCFSPCIIALPLIALHRISSHYLASHLITSYHIHRAAILEAYGGDQASPNRDVDLYSVNSITRNDTKLMRRDVHSRALSSRVDRRLATTPLAGKKKNTTAQKPTNDDKAQQGLILSEANYQTRRQHIKSLIATRKEIIQKNDEYCDEERKLINGEYHHTESGAGTGTDRSTRVSSSSSSSSSAASSSARAGSHRRQKDHKLMDEKELLQSVSLKRLDVLHSLHNAPTLTAIKSDTALLNQRKQKTSFRNLRQNTAQQPGSGGGSGGFSASASMSLQQKLDVLEDLMMTKSASGPLPGSPKVKRVTMMHS
jgi:hypothetical protein